MIAYLEVQHFITSFLNLMIDPSREFHDVFQVSFFEASNTCTGNSILSKLRE